MSAGVPPVVYRVPLRLATRRSGRTRRLAGLLALALFLPGMPGARAASPSISVVAHRGASGYLPEHTLAAYALAHGLGADRIEPDLVLTRDGILVARHDITLEQTTDVAELFPGRARDDGHYYAIDFDLAEIRRLRAVERRPGRFTGSLDGVGVPTFAEIVHLIRELNRLTGRTVGLVPELKAAAWHAQEGQDLVGRFATVLDGLRGEGGLPAITVQSFEPAALAQLDAVLPADVARLQLVDVDAAADLHPERLARWRGIADIVAVNRELLDDAQGCGRAAAIRDAGYELWAWTVRADALRPRDDTLARTVAGLAARGVTGIFTDHPDQVRALVAGLDATATDCRETTP